MLTRQSLATAGSDRRRIIFVTDGLAFYPTMIAAKRHLSALGYQVEERRRSSFHRHEDLSDAILWMMMGFYPRNMGSNCLAVIHEYRSQSTGRFGELKDLIKRMLNHRPSYRLFQSDRIRDAFNRDDGVPTALLPLGISSHILELKESFKELSTTHDFCYIGSVSEERCLSRMIDSFLGTYGESKTMVLAGDVRDGLDLRYRAHSNLTFLGKVSQEEALKAVMRSRYSVCYFPNHPPHCFQPPTKLYEYAALGRRIIGNRSLSAIGEADRLGINLWVMPDSSFPAEHELASLSTNEGFDPDPILLDGSLKNSGILDFIDRTFQSSRTEH